MKYFLLFLAIFAVALPKNSFSQDTKDLTFDKKYIQCINKWIAFTSTDNKLVYGFVYVDTEAGLTLDVGGFFKVENNVYVPAPREVGSWKVRIPATTKQVALVPISRLKELGVNEFPDWLKIYEQDAASAKRLFKMGFIYNEWNVSETALTYLEKAKAIDPNIPGLKTEFAFAYNVLKQYEKAIVILQEILKDDVKDCYPHKELVYAQMNLGLAEDAKKSALRGIENCNNPEMKGEMAYNIAYLFFKLKDKTQFETWAIETAKWLKADHELIKYLAELKIKLENKE